MQQITSLLPYFLHEFPWVFFWLRLACDLKPIEHKYNKQINQPLASLESPGPFSVLRLECDWKPKQKIKSLDKRHLVCRLQLVSSFNHC